MKLTHFWQFQITLINHLRTSGLNTTEKHRQLKKGYDLKFYQMLIFSHSYCLSVLRGGMNNDSCDEKVLGKF